MGFVHVRQHEITVPLPEIRAEIPHDLGNPQAAERFLTDLTHPFTRQTVSLPYLVNRHLAATYSIDGFENIPGTFRKYFQKPSYLYFDRLGLDPAVGRERILVRNDVKKSPVLVFGEAASADTVFSDTTIDSMILSDDRPVISANSSVVA